MQFAAKVTPTPKGWGGKGGLCSDWQGVGCGDGGQLQSVNLDLSTAGYIFSGSPDFTALPSGLQTVVLMGNKFSGTPDLTALPSGLKTLTLGFNSFSGTPDLSALPSSLESLTLAFNRFSGTPDLTVLPSSLKELDLTVNDFKGSGSFRTPARWCHVNGHHDVCGHASAHFDCKKGTWQCD